MTRAPSAANAEAMAWPMPAVLPDTSASLPLSFRSMDVPPSSMTLDSEHNVGETRHRVDTIPVALELADELHPGRRLPARLHDTLQAGLMRCLRRAGHRIDDGIDLVPRPQRIQRGEHQADLRPQRRHHELVATGRLDGCDEVGILP